MSGESDSPATTKLDCCIGQSAQFAGVTPATAAPLVAPLTIVSLTVAAPDSLYAALPALPPFDADVSNPSNTPTYLLVSVFRI